MVLSLTLEGSKSQAIFQRNKINLAHQLGFRGAEIEVAGLLINLKAELVEKRPFEEGGPNV